MNIKLLSGEDLTITTKGNYTVTVPDLTGTLELTSNKVTSISSNSTNTLYPSALAVYNAISNASIGGGGSDAGDCPDLSLGTTSGNGNAVTDISVSGHEITMTKGSTFLTSETSLSKGTTTGSGNAVTDISVSGHEITLTKGTSFVDLTSALTISGIKTFSSGLKLNAGTSWTSSDRAIPFSASGNSTTILYVNDNSNTGLTFNPNTGALKAASFVKRGGTSSQFLKADGSVDSNTYLTSHQDITGKADKAVPSAANNVALLDATGNLVDSGKTLGKSVPSNAVFTDTDTKVTAAQYHYTPETDNASSVDLVPSGVLKILTAVNIDSKGHITSITSGDLTKTMVGLSAVTNNKQVKGLASGTTSGHIVTFGSDGYTIADSGVSTSDFATSTHVHGNITNAGALQTTDITIANGDKLVVTDSSNSNKVARASATFDGSTTSSVLTKKGTFESLKTINGNSIIGTGDITITGGNGSDAGEDLGPLFITSYITDSSVDSGTYDSITQAITDGRDVILKVTNDNVDDEIRYYRLLMDYTATDYQYIFSCAIGSLFHMAIIANNNSLSFATTPIGGSGLPSLTSSDNGKILLVVNGTWTLVTPPAIYSGSTTPSSSLGNNGDIYIQTS